MPIALIVMRVLANSVASAAVRVIDGAIVRLVGALLLGQNDGWAVARFTTQECVRQLNDDPPVSLPAVAR